MNDYRNQIITGDALTILRGLPDGIAQTCITSPPYFGLRDYGTAQWDGGSAECDHRAPDKAGVTTKPSQGQREHAGRFSGPTCWRCGATRIDQQIGLEEHPEEYIEKLVTVFREVRRVLRDDGTFWCNIGDSYANDDKWGGTTGGKHAQGLHGEPVGRRRRYTGLKPKDLIGIPWLLAFALRADGWYLRSGIIWYKPNAMPESVEDRPTSAHEHIFLLAKSERYYYDAQAIAEPAIYLEKRNGRVGASQNRAIAKIGDGTTPTAQASRDLSMRNKRNVWTVASQPFSAAHFATFPPKLIEPCILAGSSPRACEQCGAPWERVTEREPMVIRNGPKSGNYGSRTTDGLSGTMIAPAETKTVGWQPTCSCKNEGTGRSLVLDPFLGAGTTALVALQQHRAYLGIELNPDYVELAQKRIAAIQPVLWEVML